MGEGLQPTPEEERVGNLDEAEEMARAGDSLRTESIELRKKAEETSPANIWNKIGLKRRDTRESLENESQEKVREADEVEERVQKQREAYLEEVNRYSKGDLEARKQEIKNLQSKRSFEDIARFTASCGITGINMIAALEMTNLSLHEKANLLCQVYRLEKENVNALRVELPTESEVVEEYIRKRSEGKDEKIRKLSGM